MRPSTTCAAAAPSRGQRTLGQKARLARTLRFRFLLFTDDVNRLSQQLGTEVTKTAALEINQSVPIGQGLGMD